MYLDPPSKVVAVAPLAKFAPAPTGGECDTVGVTASKEETLVDKSTNTNVANQAAVDHEDKSNHEVSIHTTAARRNGQAGRVRSEALSERACERLIIRHDVQYAAVSGDCDVRALE